LTVGAAVNGPSGDFDIIVVLKQDVHDETLRITRGSPKEMTGGSASHNGGHQGLKGFQGFLGGFLGGFVGFRRDFRRDFAGKLGVHLLKSPSVKAITSMIANFPTTPLFFSIFFQIRQGRKGPPPPFSQKKGG
jgi:hypothetical protein